MNHSFKNLTLHAARQSSRPFTQLSRLYSGVSLSTRSVADFLGLPRLDGANLFGQSPLISRGSLKEELPQSEGDFFRYRHFGVKQASLEKETTFPWFPTTESDLDKIGKTLLVMNDGRNQDHPSYTDLEYRKRRDKLCEVSMNYQMSEEVPLVNYSPEEHQLWGKIYKNIRPLHKELACKKFNDAIEALEKEGIFSPDEIPQQKKLNSFLKAKTNWRIKPVNGILSQREFLNCLAFRTFCSTMYIRHPSIPDYTPEPDIMHEYLGHIPNFADPKICDISQKLGMLSLGATDEQIAEIGTIYWYTVEFGLCKEDDGKIKVYGAGPAGSVAEFNHVKEILNDPQDRLRPLDISNQKLPQDIIIQDVQPFFYVAESFDDFMRQLDVYASTFKKPFNLHYKASTNSYDIDRSIRMKNFVAGV